MGGWWLHSESEFHTYAGGIGTKVIVESGYFFKTDALVEAFGGFVAGVYGEAGHPSAVVFESYQEGIEKVFGNASAQIVGVGSKGEQPAYRRGGGHAA